MHSGKFICGVITGAVVGATMSALLDPLDAQHGVFSKRNLKKAARRMNDMMDDMMDMKKSW